MTLEEKIVALIHADLNDRAGLGMDGIDDDIMAEIQAKHAAIVLTAIAEDPERKALEAVAEAANEAEGVLQDILNGAPICELMDDVYGRFAAAITALQDYRQSAINPGKATEAGKTSASSDK